MTSRPRLPTAILAAVSVSVFSCAGEQKPAVPAAARKLTPLTMNFRPSMTHAATAIAREEGFFEQEGIDARLVEMDLNSTMMAASGRSLDVLSIPLRSGLFNLMLRGLRLQIVADQGHYEPGTCASSALIAPPAIADRVLATGNLRGERIALIRGGSIEFVMDAFVRSRGQRLEDMELVQLPQGEGGSVLAREVDAIRYVSEPNLTNALRDGRHRIIATTQDIATFHQGNNILFGRRLLDEEPELGRRFMRAYLRGVRQYNQGKTPRNVEILSRHTGLPPAVIRSICWQPIAPDGSIRPDSVEPFLAWALEHGYLEKPIAASQWLNLSFVEAANRDLAGAR